MSEGISDRFSKGISGDIFKQISRGISDEIFGQMFKRFSVVNSEGILSKIPLKYFMSLEKFPKESLDEGLTHREFLQVWRCKIQKIKL